MEEGCILPCDGKDQEIIEKTLKKGRNYQVNPELLQGIPKIETTFQPGEEGFNKNQYNLEKEAEKIRRIIEFVLELELEKEDEIKMKEAGGRYVGSTRDRRLGYTDAKTGEIRINYKYRGKIIPPERFYAVYVHERVHAIDRYKINEVQEKAKKGEIDKLSFVSQMLRFEARAVIRQHEFKEGLENKLKNGTIENKIKNKNKIAIIKRIIKRVIKYLEDKDVDFIISFSKSIKNPEILEKKVAEIMWSRRVAGINIPMGVYYANLYDYLRSKGMRESDSEKENKNQQNYERKIQKSD